MKRPLAATRITWFDFHSPPMRAFHLSWMAFFLCFFAWFGIAPLMSVVRDELQLSKAQVGWCLIASVAMTVVARLAIGWLCDRFGPRRTYAGLLIVTAFPVAGIGLAHSFASFLLFRLLIGVAGASFVITQYHASVMFAPNCVGTANATTAGWGNLGGGVTQLAMPLLFAWFARGLGLGDAVAWRAAMVVAGAACFVMGIVYYRFTHDTPAGNPPPALPKSRGQTSRFFFDVCRDRRTWALFVAYGACFGVELTIKNIAALYFADEFQLGLTAAGAAAAAYGMMNIFARTLGGWTSDRINARWGLNGRVIWLFVVLLGESLAIILFSQMRAVTAAVASLMLLGLFVQMASGATYAVVPFVNRRAMGSVAGIVGAGGNVGAVAAGFLFQGDLPWNEALFVLGVVVFVASFAALLVRLTDEPAAALDPLALEALTLEPATGATEGRGSSLPTEGDFRLR